MWASREGYLVDPNWIIALCSAATLVGTVLWSVFKFTNKIRSDRNEQQERIREAAHAQAEEALRIAREESKYERTQTAEATQKYQESLLKRIEELQQDVDNEQRAREALQRRYEDLLKGMRNYG